MDWQLAAPTLLELILCILVVILVATMGVLYSHINKLRSALSESEEANAEAIARAEDLVKQGASIDEIIEACDIPRAEAEMLVMVHKQNS
jgi:membrane protein required for beta-lactamase induction